ncbi:MAG: hypothetical protein IH934_00905 [Nanoarchaeota archaeon]|nr:hypothetical protein [Nanoarchaeota archaeon]
MTPETYDPRRLQRDYIQACIDAGSPLDPVRESILEQTVTNTIQRMGEQHEALDIQLMDRDVLGLVCEELGFPHSGLVIRAVQKYANLDFRKHPTNAQALRLYQKAIGIIDTPDYPRNVNFGEKTFRSLHSYLYVMRLVEEKKAPQPFDLLR